MHFHQRIHLLQPNCSILLNNDVIISFIQIVPITVVTDHISQHECVMVVQLLGISGDKLINNGVLLQEIGPHLNLHHPQCSSFIIVVQFTNFLAYLCNFSISPLLQCQVCCPPSLTLCIGMFHFSFYHYFYFYCCIVNCIIQIYMWGKIYAFRQCRSIYSIHIVVFHQRLLLVVAFYHLYGSILLFLTLNSSSNCSS